MQYEPGESQGGRVRTIGSDWGSGRVLGIHRPRRSVRVRPYVWLYAPLDQRVFCVRLEASLLLSPYRVWLNTQICVLRITPIYRLGNMKWIPINPASKLTWKNLFYFQYLKLYWKLRYFQSNIQPEFFFIQLGTLITPTYRFIEIMKVRKIQELCIYGNTIEIV